MRGELTVTKAGDDKLRVVRTGSAPGKRRVALSAVEVETEEGSGTFNFAGIAFEALRFDLQFD